MTEGASSRDGAMEALDLVINVLKEHEASLDSAIENLSDIQESMGQASAVVAKVDKLGASIDRLQQDFSEIAMKFSDVLKTSTVSKQQEPLTASAGIELCRSGSKHSVMLECKSWEDFESQSLNSQFVSFNFKDGRVLEAKAIKNDIIINYTGTLPSIKLVLKAWLSNKLNVPQKCIFEGSLMTNDSQV